jgi:hypothetical protein
MQNNIDTDTVSSSKSMNGDTTQTDTSASDADCRLDPSGHRGSVAVQYEKLLNN